MVKVKYDKLYVIFAVKRSGHHGIANWMCQQSSDGVLYWDFCDVRKNDIFVVNKKRLKVYNNGGEERVKFVSFEGFGSEGINILSLSDVKRYNFKELKTVKEASQVYYVIINRDPYNFIASCLNRCRINPSKRCSTYDGVRGLIDGWKELLKESLGETSVLKGYNTYDINFNKWFSDIRYRKHLCEYLDMSFTDDGLNDVLLNGGGSSFDKLKFNGQAQQMNVLERYKEWENDKLFVDLVNDNELRRLATEYFGKWEI